MKALLLEIKRLHGVLVQAHELAAALPRYEEDLNAAYTAGRLAELLGDEPAVTEPPRPRYGKPEHPEPEQRFPHMTEREEKRIARERRG